MRGLRIIRHDGAENRWRVVHGDAAARLWPHVGAYAEDDETTHSFMRRREMPSLRPTLILNLSAPIGIVEKAGTRFGIGTGQGFLAGLHDRPALSESSGSQRGGHIWLSALGAAALLGGIAASLANQLVVLRDVLGPDVDSLAARLIDAQDSGSRFTLLDAFFERRLADATLPCPEIIWAWNRLVTAPTPRIDRLAREIGWSQRRLAAGFVRHVGHPPRTITLCLTENRAAL